MNKKDLETYLANEYSQMAEKIRQNRRSVDPKHHYAFNSISGENLEERIFFTRIIN